MVERVRVELGTTEFLAARAHCRDDVWVELSKRPEGQYCVHLTRRPTSQIDRLPLGVRAEHEGPIDSKLIILDGRDMPDAQGKLRVGGQRGAPVHDKLPAFKAGIESERGRAIDLASGEHDGEA
jgi:hypothetical protein